MTTLCQYRSAPTPSSYFRRTLDELNRILETIYASEHTATTEAARAGFDLDCRIAEEAIELASLGKTILVTQDEDGYYFAIAD